MAWPGLACLLLALLPACATPKADQTVRDSMGPEQSPVPLLGGVNEELRDTAGRDVTPGPWERVWRVLPPTPGGGDADAARVIQAAVDSAGLAGGGLVLLPNGVFHLASTIEISHDNVQVRGAGMGRTVLVVGPHQHTAAIVAAGSPPSGFVRNIHVSDLTIDGNRAEKSQHYIGIFLQRVQGGSVHRVESMRSTDIGFGFGDASIPGPTTRDLVVSGCWAHDNTGNGFDAANVTRVLFFGNRSEHNGVPGVSSAAGFFTGHGSTSDITYIDNIAVGNAGTAFQASSGRPDGEDEYTRGIWYLHNVALASVPAPGTNGEAFLLNRGGRGPTAMAGPFEFAGNRTACNSMDSVHMGRGVTGVLDRGNTFGLRFNCERLMARAPSDVPAGPSRHAGRGAD